MAVHNQNYNVDFEANVGGSRSSPCRVKSRRVLRALVVVGLSIGCATTGPLFAQDSRRTGKPRKTRLAQRALNQGHLLAPKAFRASVRKVLPSVVTIESFGGLSTSAIRGTRGVRKPGDGPTTGLIVSPDGFIVTSTFNFIRRPPVITVILRDGSRHVAKLLGRDDTRKICLLKVDGMKDLTVPTFVRRSKLKVGQWAVSVGVGYGDSKPAMSAGIISAKNRISGRAVQTDANISPANYGGPLLDIEGRVIGICVPLHPQSQQVASGVEWYDSGIGFAVPLAGADGLLAQLKAGKIIRPASLGVQVKTAGPDGSGVVVAKVQDGAAAGKAGVTAGDRILAINGEKILDVRHLLTVIGRFVAGDKIQLQVERAGKSLELKVTLDVATAKKPPVRKRKKVEKKKSKKATKSTSGR